jgi:uncharacterized ferritin-like protein (DUF455 family)
MKRMNEEQATELFNEFFNEVIGDVKIGNLTYEASRTLKEVDPIAYHQEFLNWMDFEEIEIEDES